MRGRRTTPGYAQGLRQPSRLAFALTAILVPLALAMFALWLAQEYGAQDAVRKVVRGSYDRRIAELDLISTLKDAETGQRGYVITGDPSFLEPFREAKAHLPDELKRLRALTADTPEQTARVDRLSKLVDRKFAEMDSVLRLRDTAGPAAAAARVSDGEGRDLMDQARAVAGAMIATEQQRLDTSRALSMARAAGIQHIIWALVVVIAVVLALSLAWIWAARRSRYLLQLGALEAAGRLEAIFAGTVDAIVLLNPSGTIEEVNRAATTMLGYEAQELFRRDISVLLDIAPGDGNFYDRIGMVDGVLRHSRRADCTARHKDGHEVPVDVALGLMPLPDGMHVVAAVRDASDRKAVERMKDDFISTVSHELRTPLTSIVGSLGLLRAEKVAVLPDAARRLVEIAENNSRRLIRLINDILDIEKIGSGQMRFETAPVDMRALIRNAALGSEGLASSSDIAIDVGVPQEPIVVRGDAERLLQVVTNLMSNAIRFTPPGGVVQLLMEAGDGKVVVMVDDQGPGVPAEFRDRMFARFAQAHSGTPAGGTGLGLAISQEIIRAHDGRIWFENRPEGGARFQFSLDTVRLPSPAQDDDDRPHILICEDDADAAATLRAMVEAEGCRATIVGTVGDAQAAIETERFDALLLDLNLPDGNGLSVIRAVRDGVETRDLPIIVVSGNAPEGESGIALDMIDWLQKPVDQDRLNEAVRLAVMHSAVTAPTLLHIDDDVDLLDVTAAALDGHGRIIRAETLAAARQVLANERPDIVILDLGLPDGSGAELIPLLRDGEEGPIPTIIYSAQDVSPEVELKVQAVLVKSKRSLPNLAGAIQRILARQKKIGRA